MSEERQDELTRTAAEGGPETDEREDEDTEGHVMLPGSGGERDLSRLRGGDIDRNARERQREKEARVNRPGSR